MPGRWKVGRELISDHLAELPNVAAIVADRGYRGSANLVARKHLALDIGATAPPLPASRFWLDSHWYLRSRTVPALLPAPRRPPQRGTGERGGEGVDYRRVL